MASSRKRPQADLTASVADFLKQHSVSGKQVLLGLSGGLDSRVLLHLLAQCQSRLGFNLSAMHVNHQISPHASHWADFCTEICHQVNIQCLVNPVNVPRDSGLGLEAAARLCRYEALFSTPADVVVLAHHQDDQAETFLLQLMRGAGVKGLAAMGEKRMQPATTSREVPLLRPLLNVSRETLADYAASQGLQWIEDESNSDIDFDRNYIRHEFLPILKQRFPACLTTISRSASNMAEAAELMDEIAQEDARHCLDEAGRLLLASVSAMSLPRITNLLRFWVTEQTRLALSAARMDDIRRQLLESKPDARVHVSVGHWVLRRKKGWAFFEEMQGNESL